MFESLRAGQLFVVARAGAEGRLIGESRIRPSQNRAMKAVFHVTFVCMGNIFRSPQVPAAASRSVET
jgi:hypothetical protein